MAFLSSSKRLAAAGNGRCGHCRWEDMNPEVLGLIFSRLPADVVLRSMPFVCRSWRAAIAGPYCWEEIDLQQWCRRVNRTDVIDAAIRKLVRRSAGSLRRLSAYRIGTSAFNFTADMSKCLSVLQIPMSGVTDDSVGSHAKALSLLTVLDISYCLSITHKGIETLGKHCSSLIQLRRNMPPPEIELSSHEGGASKPDEDEALAVANTMPGLQHLELSYGRFSDHGLEAIIKNCRSLCVLDIRGCWDVKMEGGLEEECYGIPDFRGPWYDEYDDVGSSDDY